MTHTAATLRDKLRSVASEAMLDAAEATMLERGFGGATMQEIAQRAGCAVGTLYLHFKTKDELFHGLVQRHGAVLRERIMAAIAKQDDPVAKLRCVVEENVRWAAERPAMMNVFCTAMPMRYFDLAQLLDRILPPELGELQQLEKQLIGAAQERGLVRTDWTAEQLAQVVRGLMLTVLDQFAARPGGLDVEGRIALTWGFIAGGLGVEKQV